jgi:hypothetical protein
MTKEKHHFSLPKHSFLTIDHDPARILQELFSSYTIEDIRIIMWEKLKAELASGYYESQKERNDAIFFYETVLTSLEAVYVVHNKETKQAVRKKK